MISPYVFLLILAGLMGIHSITTVSKVSVRAGDSISIPCLYDSQYINHVKYLSKGYFGSFYIVNTIKQNSGRFSISDDKTQRVFNVTVEDLTTKDTRYWCNVKKEGTEVKEYFQLSVTKGIPSLYVDQQEIIAFVGGNVTVKCYNDDPEVAKWCRLGSFCVTETESINGTRGTIDSSVPNSFTVTMSGLKTESSGWYLCVNGQFQMPVHITVIYELPSTTSTTTSTKTARPSPATTQHSSLPTSAEPYTAHPTNSTTNGTGEDSPQEHDSSTKVMILTTTLVLLLLFVPSAFFGWKMMRRNKTKPEGSNITEGSQIGSDPDEHYAAVVHTQHAEAQQQTEPVDGSVMIYSTLHTKKE